MQFQCHVRRELDGGDYLRLYQHPLEEEIYLKIKDNIETLQSTYLIYFFTKRRFFKCHMSDSMANPTANLLTIQLS